MARDKITVDLLLATKQAEREIAKINRKLGDMGKTMGKAFGGTGAGGDKVRALGTGLSKATVKADEFSKSMEASNARVIAFGASAGLIMGIDRALKAMVSSAIKVEKALLDVNVVLNATHRDLEKFGKGMFKIAKDTAQGFDTVAEAATELARQGLGMEKTLGRTKDALILTRLTGMGAADAVKTLTAAVNSFNKEGATSAQIINRMAKVDAAFAVSSEDLAKSISRVGASAVSAGVNMNELMAITTAVQQKTARGGAVIGNAFKTIFTRLQRKDVLQNLRNLGVAVNDLGTGKALSGIQVLQNLAKEFDGLGKATQASTAEQVAGVFQVNILKAALSDLSSVNSQYASSLKVANSATNEAYERNEQLNQSLDALVNRTLANLTAAGAGLGGTLEPAIKNILGTVNSVIEAFGKGGVMEGFGKTIGSGLMKGLGDFIGGPGLIVMTAVFGKIALSLGRFAKSAFMDILNINEATKQRAVLEEAVVAHIASEPQLLARVRTGTLNVLNVEQDILATIRAANAERTRIQTYAAPLTGALMSRGVKAGSRGATIPGGAGGFIPNFADAGSERAAAAAGGYRAGSIKMMNQPGAGEMMYNSAETVKKFPGMSQSAIMPPQGSPAGAGYKSAFGAAHGFDPYAGRGFVPNFAAYKPFGKQTIKPEERQAQMMSPAKRAGGVVNLDIAIPNTRNDVGVITEKGKAHTPISFSQNAMLAKGGIPGLKNEMKNWVGADGRKVGSAQLRLSGIPVVPVFPFSDKDSKTMNATGETRHSFESPLLRKALTEYSTTLSKKMFRSGASPSRNFNMKNLGEGTAGDIFEEGVRAAVGGLGNEDKQAAFDFNGSKFATSHLIGFFNRRGATNLGSKSKIESKIGAEAAKSGNIPNKMMRDPSVGATQSEVLAEFKAMFKSLTAVEGKKASFGPRKGKALGFVPNFSPLTSAIGREMQAGVPASAIRVGSSSALKSAGNPGGMGVYNTIHEPAGLQQGISRARSQGVNPKGHGVPNFQASVFGSAHPMTSPTGPDMGRKYYHEGSYGPSSRASASVERGMEDAGKAAKDSAAASKEATTQTKRMGAAMGGMMVQMAAGAAAANMEEGSAGQTGVRGAGSIAGYAGMGFMMGGPWGAAAGAAIGGVGLGIDILQKHTDEAKNSFASLSAELEKIKENSNQVSQSLELVANKIAKLGEEKDPLKRTGLMQDIISDMLNSIANVSNPDIKYKLQNKYRTMKAQGLSEGDVRSLREEILKESANDEASVMARLQGSKIRGVGGMMDPNAEGTEGARGGFGLDFLSNRASKKDWGSMAQGIGNPAAWFTRSIAGISHNLGGPGKSMSWDASNRLGRQLQARKYAPDYTDQLMGTKIDGVELQRRIMGSEGGIRGKTSLTTRGRAGLADLQARLEKDGSVGHGVRTGTAWDAFEKDGAMTDILVTAGMSREMMKVVRASLNTEEARNMVLRRMFGMGQAPVKTGWADMQFDVPAVEENEGAAFSRTQRDLHGRSWKAAPAVSQAPRAPAGIEPFTDLIDSTRMASAEVTELGLATARQVVHEKKLRSIQSRYDIALAGKGMGDSRTVAQKTMEVALDEAEKGLTDGTTAAINKFTSKVADSFEAMAGDFKTWASKNAFFKGGWHEGGDVDIMGKTISGQGGAGPKGQLSKSQMGMQIYTAMTTGNIDREALKSDYDTAIERRDTKQTLTLKDMMVLEFAPKVLKTLNGAVEQYNADIAKETDLREKAIEAAKTGNKVTLKTIELAGRYARGMELQNQRLALSRKTERLDFIDGDLASGRITGKQYAGFKGSQKKASRDYLGLTEENMKSSIFKDTFTYNPREALDDFEAGQASVAQNMKSSFADAFQSIASGASSAQDAFANMAQSILNSISSMSANMMTNMLFSKMGWQGSQGGLVPGYAGGGVVRGGSGYKDDVPTMMQGGEFVIKKSSAQKIGYGKLNAINGYAEGGPTMGKMGMVAMGASALSGVIGSAMQPGAPKPLPSRDYGLGKGKYGHFGGADPDAGQVDTVTGGGGRAGVSLGKAFVHYRRDPETGRLISERARPTEGRFEVSRGLSLMGRLGEDDPQTARMFGKEQSMAKYQDYLETETASRKAQIDAVKKQKKQRLIGAYMNAAMMIGGAKFMQGQAAAPAMDSVNATGMPDWATAGTNINYGPTPDVLTSSGMPSWALGQGGGGGGDALGGYKHYANGGSASGTPAMVMGGEYIMSPETVRTHGANFMHELNRGNVPSYASGGPVGGTSAGNQGPHSETLIGGNTTNNVKISVNIDKAGKADASADTGSGGGGGGEREDNEQANQSKEFGKILQGVVLDEIVKQQRPGGLLQGSPHTP